MATTQPSGPARTMTSAWPVRRTRRRAASAGSSLPVSRAASRWLQLHQSQRASTGSSTAAGMSATSGPGSTNSRTPAGRLAAQAPRTLARPGRDQAVAGDVDRVAGPDPDQVPRAGLGQRLGAQRGDERPLASRLDQGHVEPRVRVRIGRAEQPDALRRQRGADLVAPRPGAVAARVDDGQALPDGRGHDVEPAAHLDGGRRPRACRRRVRAARAPTSAGRRSPRPRRPGGSAPTGSSRLLLVSGSRLAHRPGSPWSGIAQGEQFAGERRQAEALGVDGRDGLGREGAGAVAGTGDGARPSRRSCRSRRRARRPAGRPATGRRAPRPAPRTRPAPTPGWPGWCRPGCR